MEAISVNKGIWQRCPLSPLLFILAIEILARKIRQDSRNKGIKIDDVEFQMESYIDDVVTLLNPPKLLQYIIEYTENFGFLLGYKINRKKPKNGNEIFNIAWRRRDYKKT